MIDTHCHLTDPRLAEQIDAVLERAEAAGVGRVITIGTALADARAAVALCERHPGRVRCAVGVHPGYVNDERIGRSYDWSAFRALHASPHVVAAGEIGLDYYWPASDEEKATQRVVFAQQLELAQALKKPVVLHSRGAVDDTLAILGRFAGVRAVFHCFTGTSDEAQRVLSAGHWLSFTGPITYKKNAELRSIVAATPRDRLMVETDAPYLSPEPKRGQKVNEPALVVHTAAVVAQAWGIGLAEVDRLTTQTAEQFFGMSLA
jgi:TatD DNase family protein